MSRKIWAISRKSWGILIGIPPFTPYSLAHACVTAAKVNAYWRPSYRYPRRYPGTSASI
jgi:hypothetical protein